MNSKKGFTLIELVVVFGILTVLLTGVMIALVAGRNSWVETDSNIQLRENLRVIMEKVGRELRESGSDAAGVLQVAFSDNTGFNNSDILRFSIPVVCEAGGSLMDVNGDVAHWGAASRWGCKDLSCLDTDGNCATVEYKYIEYQINSNNQLLRRALNPALAVVKEEIFAQNISNFQAQISADQNIVTLTVTMLSDADINRRVSTTNTLNVLLRNRG